MGKLAERFLLESPESLVEINRTLSENNSCYVLITCSVPSQDGRMDVAFSYGGDPVLAAYLVEDAQKIIETDIVQT